MDEGQRLGSGPGNATSFDASHTFNTQGRYIVTLTAYNGDPACTDIDTVIMEVTCPAIASFTLVIYAWWCFVW